MMLDLIHQRRSVKAQIKAEEARGAGRGGVAIALLNERERAIKLASNATYGVLGRPLSRFFGQPLAALITRRGQQVLRHAWEKAVALGYEVLYGVTDSMKILLDDCETQTEAYEHGERMCEEINKPYRYIRMTVSQVFLNSLLLCANKYAALALVGLPSSSSSSSSLPSCDLVMRGLEPVHGDQCQLVKHVVETVLQYLLGVDDAVRHAPSLFRKIRRYLQQVHHSMWELHQIPVHWFVLTRGLSKALEEYHDFTETHVRLASQLRLVLKRPIHAGDRISFVRLCLPTNDDVEIPPPLMGVAVPGLKDAADRIRYDWIHEDHIATTLPNMDPSTVFLDYDYYWNDVVMRAVYRVCKPWIDTYNRTYGLTDAPTTTTTATTTTTTARRPL